MVHNKLEVILLTYLTHFLLHDTEVTEYFSWVQKYKHYIYSNTIIKIYFQN